MTVLYDEPGPKAKRRGMIASVVIGLVLLALGYFFVIRPLQRRGQLSMERWGSLIDPSNPVVGQVWDRLLTGLLATLQAAVLAIITSLVFGTLVAMLRMELRALGRRRYVGLPRPVAMGLRGLNKVLNAITRAAIEVFRGLPVLVSIFFAWRLSGIVNPMWPLVIGLTVYNGVVIAEIIRSGMDGLPGGQREAAESIGLTSGQSVRLVLLPQAFRIMLPALISQLVVIVKDTSLGFVIFNFSEFVRTARIVIQFFGGNEGINLALQMFVAVALVFILINYALGKLAEFVQRRLARGGRTAAAPVTGNVDGGAAGGIGTV